MRAVRCALGATVVSHGVDMTDAEANGAQVAAETGQQLLGTADHPVLLAGVGTVFVEMFGG